MMRDKTKGSAKPTIQEAYTTIQEAYSAQEHIDEVSARLTVIRRIQGLTQEEVAQRAKLSLQIIKAIEHSEYLPTSEHFAALSQVYKLHPTYLSSGKDWKLTLLKKVKALETQLAESLATKEPSGSDADQEVSLSSLARKVADLETDVKKLHERLGY